MHRDGIKLKKKIKTAPAPIKCFPDLCQGPSVQTPSSVVRGRIPPAPPPPPNLTKVMRFDIKLETVTRLQQKPRAMYTFLCAQEMRRDQWESHSR